MKQGFITKDNEKLFLQSVGIKATLKKGHLYDLDATKEDEEDTRTNQKRACLIDRGPIILPQETIFTEEMNEYINRIIKHFEKTTRETTGAYFHGLKGAGKTVLMDTIFVKANIPVINVNNEYEYYWQTILFDAYGDDIGLRFDEFEGYAKNNDLLQLLDGSRKPYKKLVIMTANLVSSEDDKLLSRPSRITYIKKFTPRESEFIETLTNDKRIIRFIQQNFAIISMDTASSFIEEIEMMKPDLDDAREMRKLAEGMNIKLTADNRFESVDVSDWTTDTTINSIWKQYQSKFKDAKKEEFMKKMGFALDDILAVEDKTNEEKVLNTLNSFESVDTAMNDKSLLTSL